MISIRPYLNKYEFLLIKDKYKQDIHIFRRHESTIQQLEYEARALCMIHEGFPIWE